MTNKLALQPVSSGSLLKFRQTEMRRHQAPRLRPTTWAVFLDLSLGASSIRVRRALRGRRRLVIAYCTIRPP
jgi:hypothetical protein